MASVGEHAELMIESANKAVFLSYASQDAEAARRICDALRAAGVEVWFDQSELRGGDAWDAKIRKQIKECALFVPVISANTQARTEGYFRLEWRLADQRTHLMAKGRPFLVPVVIDTTRDSDAHVPDSFLDVQWTSLTEETRTEAFAHRVAALVGGRSVGLTATAVMAAAKPDPTTRIDTRSKNRAVLLGLACAIFTVIGAGLWKYLHHEKAASAPRTAKHVESEAEKRAAQAMEISQRLGHSQDDLAAADALAKEACELESSTARMWGVRAWVNAMFLVRSWDISVTRRQTVETLARRALALDPNEPDAITASAQVLLSQGAAAQAEAMARQADRVRPNFWRTLSVLATALGAQGKFEEQRAIYQQILQRDPTAVLARYGLAQSYVSRTRGRPSALDVERALAELDRAIAQAPFFSGVYLKATYLAGWRGDLVGMRAMLNELEKFPAFNQADDQPLHIAMWGGLLERKPERTIAAASLTTRGYLEHAAIAGPKAWHTAMARLLDDQTERARVDWLTAESVLRERLRERPDARGEKLQLGVTLAWLGRADEARQQVEPFLALAREGGDAVINHLLALYHAATGDAAAAVPCLRRALNVRTRLTDYTLPIDPWWDRLRGKPEFEALLGEAAERRAEDAKQIAAMKTAAERGNSSEK